MSEYSQSVEDYLEALYVIGLEKKVVRVKDVAQELGVTMPSVVAAVRSLSEKGLVIQERYGHIELTPKGEKVAKKVYARHQALYGFFREILGLDSELAEQDACQVEHYLSAEAHARIAKMVEFARACPREGGAMFLEMFKYHCKVNGSCLTCSGCDERQA